MDITRPKTGFSPFDVLPSHAFHSGTSPAGHFGGGVGRELGPTTPSASNLRLQAIRSTAPKDLALASPSVASTGTPCLCVGEGDHVPSILVAPLPMRFRSVFCSTVSAYLCF
ncbi:hypothetical protein IG631_19755 [Alternaria alternata]|nr:hypothetical protein IG631_19755 [Alternaria alternata]